MSKSKTSAVKKGTPGITPEPVKVETAYKAPKKPKMQAVKDAFLALAVGCATEDTIGPVLKAWDYRSAGFRSMEHAAAVFLGAFRESPDGIVPKAAELRSLRVTINGRTITVQAIIQTARRAINKASGTTLKGKDATLTPERLQARALRIERDAIRDDLISTAISVLEDTVKSLKARRERDKDHGHHLADKTNSTD